MPLGRKGTTETVVKHDSVRYFIKETARYRQGKIILRVNQPENHDSILKQRNPLHEDTVPLVDR